jgi:hypothetical protein
MKPIRLITSMLAAVTVMMASCSAPRLAQQNTVNDDVYNSVAQAQEYVEPKPSEASRYQEDAEYDEYGSSDPYYDMDYSSRINRFYYGSPFRSYFDPFYYDYYGYNSIYGYNYFSPFYRPGFSMGFGFGWGWGNYGWGVFSPYYAWNPYYGGGYLGGFYGGGYYGGGYLGGGYVNNLRGTTNYGPRPDRGRENGMGRTGAVRSTNGVISNSGSRSDRYNPNRGTPINTNANTRSRTNRGSSDTYRPTTRSTAPTRPTYNPPSSTRNDGGATRSSGSSSGGGGSRSQRGGGRN